MSHSLEEENSLSYRSLSLRSKETLLAALIILLITMVGAVFLINLGSPTGEVYWDRGGITLNGQESKSVTFTVESNRDLPLNYVVEIDSEAPTQSGNLIIENDGSPQRSYSFNNLNSQESETVEIVRNTGETETINLNARLYIQGEDELIDEDGLEVKLRDENFLGIF